MVEILGRNEPGDRWVGARTEADGQSGTNVADELLVVWTGEAPTLLAGGRSEEQEPMVSQARTGREEGEETSHTKTVNGDPHHRAPLGTML